MKIFMSFLAAIVFLMTLSACESGSEIKYLETSVTHEYIGTMTFRSEKEYNEKGELTTFIQYNDGVEFSRVEYSYTENETICKTTQPEQTGIIRQKYEKDAAGNVTRFEMYVDDVLYSVSESTYDGNGNVLTTRVESVSSGITSNIAYVYDTFGNCIRETYEHSCGIGETTEHTYDETGKIVSSVTTSLQGILTSREEHSWNEEGVELIKSSDDDGILISTAAITYDEAGNMLTSETYDESGALILRSTYTYEKFEIPVK